MNKFLASGIFASVLVAALAGTARGDDLKPLESPIRMTGYPGYMHHDVMPKQAISAPVLIEAAQDSGPAPIAPEMGLSVENSGMSGGYSRDDSDADLAKGGRRP